MAHKKALGIEEVAANVLRIETEERKSTGDWDWEAEYGKCDYSNTIDWI